MSKNAIIFGATSGIGRQLANLLVKDGYKVLITGRREERLLEIKQENPQSYFIRKHDIRHVDDSLNVFKEIPDLFGKVDLIIHNSGIGESNFNLEWDKDLPTLETNIIGATRIYQLSYNFFKEQGFGHLVGVTSVASISGNRHVPAYHASKAFQSNYLESLWMKAQRTEKARISITNILPGYVDTDIIIGDTFWMAPLDKATRQIYQAIKKKKRKVYITKRWRLVALLMNLLPPKWIVKF